MRYHAIKSPYRTIWYNWSGGYLKCCRQCHQLIYLKRDNDGQWRPYKSWADGIVAEGEWQLHDCSAAAIAG